MASLAMRVVRHKELIEDDAKALAISQDNTARAGKVYFVTFDVLAHSAALDYPSSRFN